jgi:hypothetical protein
MPKSNTSALEISGFASSGSIGSLIERDIVRLSCFYRSWKLVKNNGKFLQVRAWG